MKRKRKIDMVQAFHVVVDNRIKNSLTLDIALNMTVELSMRVIGVSLNDAVIVARSIMPVIKDEIISKEGSRNEN
jgi:hypothetical protein